MNTKSQQRLDKLLSELGFTRSEAKRMIASGRVSVSGVVTRDSGQKADARNVTVDGKALIVAEETHIMLYKPAGIVTATEDVRDRTVISLLPEGLRKKNLGPVGRLDKDTTGFVLLTTDGQLAHRLISPKWKTEKRYRVTCQGCLTQEEEKCFREGIALKDFTTLPAKIKPIECTNICSIYEVAIIEGKYHQIKRMFGALGHPVTALHRFSIAGVTLDKSLLPGEARLLTEEETIELYRRVGMHE